MIEHNVVVDGGVEHKAVLRPKFISTSSCDVCSLRKTKCHPCTPIERYDGEQIIYKLHYRPKHNELPIKVIEL